MEVKVTIQCPELAAAISKLADAGNILLCQQRMSK